MGSSDIKKIQASDDLLKAVVALQRSVEKHGDQLSRLTDGIASLLLRLDRAVAGLPLAEAKADAKDAKAEGKDSKKLTVNWVIGPPENIGWAYGNNAKRLAGVLTRYNHVIASTEPADIAIYFDAIVADRYPVTAKKSVLRIGGPRPLDRLFGENISAMREAFKKFDAIIALNAELYLRVLRGHHNVHLIPNAINLKEWSPSKLATIEDRRFTVGFAASLKSSAEADTKGYEIAKGAAARLGARLLLTSKGKDQIPHDKMIADFYSHIDVLVTPYGPGREGTSNVIMEALALGIPVVTTVHAGYHGEFLVDGKTALIRERDERRFSEAIALLQRDQKLRKKIVEAGRAFAEQHHDLTTVANAYKAVIQQMLAVTKASKAKRRKVAFVPFWEPAENFGSSRLRAKYPAEFLTKTGEFDVRMGYDSEADIVVVVQMCSDQLLAQLRANQNQYVVYDVCDQYFHRPKVFKHLEPPVNSQTRFEELVERADLVITPTRELKADIASRYPAKPVRHVPEPADYGAMPVPHPEGEWRKVALWFGNPDRGNFESARWMLDKLRDEYGFELLLVSRTSFFKKYPEYLPSCVDWSLDAMADAFRKAGVCVVAHDTEEQAKSPNRFIAAMMKGIPTLVHNSPSCAEILRETGHEFAIVRGEKELAKAMTKMQAQEFRSLFVKRVQRHLVQQFGEEATAATYRALFEDFSFSKPVYSQQRRVAFVTHNLALGEGAPWSLMELVTGLVGEDLSPYLFAPCSGPLLPQYTKSGLPVTIFDASATHTVKVLNGKFAQARDAFTKFLKQNNIEAVICNTVKAAPFAHIATELGLPAAVIVRESYTAPERYDYFSGDAKLAAIKGLTQARHVVFVAETSRQTWADQPFNGTVHVIPNGISPDRFAQNVEADKAAAREKLGLAPDKVVALCVGTITLRKGQGELLASFAELPPEVRERSQLVFLGATENGYLPEFQQQLAALPADVQAQVVVVPTTENVAPWYQASDVFLMNSSSEAYPRSVVEGLYFGLPILSTKVFGVKEQVRHGETGYMYDFNDMAAWKQHFTALVTDDAARATLSQAAARSFWMLTGYNEMKLAYRTILAEMLGPPGKTQSA